MTRHQRIVVETVHAVEFSGDAQEFPIDPPDEAGLARLRLAVENSKTRSGGAFQRMNDQRRLAVFSKRADPLLITLDDAFGGLLGRFRRQIGEVAPQFMRGLIGAHRQHDHVRRKAIERTLAVEYFLHIGVEIADINFQIDAVGKCFRPQQRHDRLDSKRAQNRQLEFCESELIAQVFESRNHKARRTLYGIAPPKLSQPPRGKIESAAGDQPVNFRAQS